MLSIINTPATSFTKVMKALQKKAGRSSLGAAVLGLACLLQSPALLAAWELNMPKGVTEISRATYDLHMIIIWMCVVISILVYGVLVYSMVKYRKSKGAVPATFHHSTTVEVIWTAIPFILLIGMAIPSTKVLTQIYDASESEIDILVTGHQWRWQYEYLSSDGEPVSFFSNMTTPDEQIYNLADKGENYLLEVDEPMVIPVNTKVRLLLTASDVIHSWWVPEFSVKKDTIPGFINESWVIAEETGMRTVSLLGQTSGWINYDLPSDMLGIALKGKYRGQAQRWFAFRFEGNESEIAIQPPPGGHEAEFDDWAWKNMAELPELIVPFKRPVYQQVVASFRHLAP